VLKPGGTMLCFAGSRTQHRMAVNVEDAGFILKDCIMWLYGSGFPKALDISKSIDKSGGKNVSCGKQKTNITVMQNIGKENISGEVDITKPSSTEAKLWNGWKSHGLKPAYEPILVAMKPNDGTYVSNALKHGVSGLNINECRIETNEVLSAEYGQPSGSGCYNWNKDKKKVDKNNKVNTQGRFPSNIILDEEAGRLLDSQSGISKSSRNLMKGGKEDTVAYVKGIKDAKT